MTARAVVIAIVIAASATTAIADNVTVKVTEVAGGVAFVTPGRKAGIVPKTVVRFRGKAFTVFEVTEKTAAIRLDGKALAVGDTGVASVAAGATVEMKKLDKPRPAESFAGQWPAAVTPAEVQSPTPVPLGTGKPPGRAHVTVVGHGYSALSKQEQAAEAEARVIATFDLLRDRPLAADLDVAGRVYSHGFDTGTHLPLFVRAAQIRYGSATDPTLALGRLRYAATSVGMLDGGRAAVKLGSIEIAAFGGLVPDPLGGKPDTGASRFGAEFIYNDIAAAWQPRIAVAAHGSTWTGQLDERRVSVVASAGHDAIWANGWAEVQQFPSGNPWNAPAVDLTGAGTTLEWRKHGTYVALDGTFLRPDRSLRLDQILGREWLCSLSGGPLATETCNSSDFWASGTIAAGIRRARFALDGVASLGVDHGVYRGLDSSAYLRAELFATSKLRFETGLSAGQASFASYMAAEIGAGLAWSRRLDFQARYRPERLDYNASTGAYIIHSFIGDAHYAMSTVFDLVGSMMVTIGADRDAVALLVTAVWRPLP